MMQIRTERLLLRSVRADDLDAFHAILSQPRAMAYWSTPPHDTLAQSREWLANMIAIARGDGEDFVIEHAGRVIGKAGFYRFPDLGYVFDPAAWRQGFAREALGAVLDRAFGVHRLSRVQADVDPRNKASLRLLARLGFVETDRQERTWLVGDLWVDSVYLALDRENWRPV